MTQPWVEPSTRRNLEKQARAKRAILARESETDLGKFIELTTPEFDRPEHLGSVMGALDLSMKEPVYAAFSTPPRHFKSETLFHHCARLLKFKPKSRIAYVTYSGDFALRKSRRIRTLAADAGVWVNREKTFKDRDDPANAVKFWQTAEGGGLIAGGRGGAFVGEGFDLVIFDDPFKNREEAESPVIRDKVWETFRMLITRLEPSGSVVVSMQRWHEDDTVARIEEMMETEPDAPRFNIINLPALSEDGTPICEARYDAAALRAIRAMQGEYNWWSQYMGIPRVPGSRLFGDWARYDTLELSQTRDKVTYQKTIAIAVDPAGTAKTSADNTSITVGAGWKEPIIVKEDGKKVTRAVLHLDIIRNITMKLEVTDVTDILYDLQTHEYPGVPIIMETQGGDGKAIVAMLRRIDSRLNIIPVTTTQDKLTRNLPYSAGHSSGTVRLPLKDHVAEPWIEDFTKEHRRFTGRGDKEDDQVDSAGHLYNYLDKAIGLVTSRRKGKTRSMTESPY